MSPRTQAPKLHIMKTPHIQTVEVAEDGLVVIFDDSTSAFYHESIFQAHLLQPEKKTPATGRRKPVSRVSYPAKTRAS